MILFGAKKSQTFQQQERERDRERETEFSRRDFVGIMSFNNAFYYICK
jgi:hypothetical protein